MGDLSIYQNDRQIGTQNATGPIQSGKDNERPAVLTGIDIVNGDEVGITCYYNGASPGSYGYIEKDGLTLPSGYTGDECVAGKYNNSPVPNALICSPLNKKKH